MILDTNHLIIINIITFIILFIYVYLLCHSNIINAKLFNIVTDLFTNNPMVTYPVILVLSVIIFLNFLELLNKEKYTDYCIKNNNYNDYNNANFNSTQGYAHNEPTLFKTTDYSV